MEHFADFLPFSEEVQEAFDNYHIEAGSLTVSALPRNMGPVIGRVVWKSPLLKVGEKGQKDAVHLTLMDANRVEITGTAWGLIALKFHEVLETGKIYKFSNAVPISKQVYQSAKNYLFESRVTNQSIELRFSGVVEPELVCQDPFPDIDQSQFRSDYENVKVGQVASIVGVVTAQFVHENEIYICFSNGPGHCVGVSFEQTKLEELKAMGIVPRYTVLGVLGAGKLRDLDTKTTGDKIPKALYKSFADSVLFEEPLCEASRQLVIWRNQLPKEKSELEQSKAL